MPNMPRLLYASMCGLNRNLQQKRQHGQMIGSWAPSLEFRVPELKEQRKLFWVILVLLSLENGQLVSLKTTREVLLKALHIYCNFGWLLTPTRFQTIMRTSLATIAIKHTVSAAPMMSLWWNIPGGNDSVCIGVGLVKPWSFKDLCITSGTPRPCQATICEFNSKIHKINDLVFHKIQRCKR